MPKRVPYNLKKKVMTELIKGNLKPKDIAKSNNVSVQTIYNIHRKDKELYNTVVQSLRQQIEGHALVVAQKSLKKIKNDKLNKSSAYQLSQIAQTLTNINKHDNTAQINVQVNVPVDRNVLISEVLNPGSVSTSQQIVDGGVIATTGSQIT